MPTQTTERTFTLEQLEQVLSDRSLHLQESKATAIRRRFEELLGMPEIAAAELVRGEHFTHTGVLMIRIHSDSGDDAREQLQRAGQAALESSPGIVAVQGTRVSRNPAPQHGGAR